VPRNLNTLLSLLNFGKDDEPSLATDKVRYKGEPIVAIVANTEREAFEALAKVRVDYEQLTPVFDVEEGAQARRAGGERDLPEEHVRVSRQIRSPEAALRRRRAGFAQADHVLEQRYQMSPIEHAPTETNGSIAAPDTTALRRLLPARKGFLSRSTTRRRKNPRRAVEQAALHRRHGRRRVSRQVDSLT
jgi:CO/xanthine dehydrogenase Mo-binding subunit